MTKFPTEKMPKEWNQDVVQRAVEDIYGNLGDITDVVERQAEFFEEALAGLNTDVQGVQSAIQRQYGGQQGPMDKPKNLQIRKIPLVPVVVMWCNPIAIIKFPYIAGFQFFASPEEGFTALDDCAVITYTGACTVSAAGNNLVDTSSVSKSSFLGSTKYTGIPFWSDMDLVDNSVSITNITKGETGTVTGWSKGSPWQITCPLSGGANWASGDKYSFACPRNKNMIGQGPLPFAVKIIPLNGLADNKWDRQEYFGKARFFGRGKPEHRKTGALACASTTGFGDLELDAPTNVAVAASEQNYWFQVTWDAGHDPTDGFQEYKVYRTTANDTNLLTDDTYLVQKGIQDEQYTDHGYDATTHPNGPCAGATYWYWVRTVDNGGSQTDFDSPDSDSLVVPNGPTFLSGTAAESQGYGNLMSWLVKWKAVGGALGYHIKYKITGGDYSPETYVAHTTLFGQDAGDDIQQYTIDGLEAGRGYTFAIQSLNNLTVTAVQSSYVEQAYTVSNANTPLPPF